jgi:hypothetical protein
MQYKIIIAGFYKTNILIIIYNQLFARFQVPPRIKWRNKVRFCQICVSLAQLKPSQG